MFKTDRELAAERAEVQEQILVELQKQNVPPEPELSRQEKRKKAIAEFMAKPDKAAEKREEALREYYKNRA